MNSNQRTLQEYRTDLGGPEVLALAKRFFSERNPLYAAFLDQEGPTHATFRGQGGEEIAIGTSPVAGGTLVTGSSYLFDMQVGRFFATLPPIAAAAGAA
jgi:hypothetical protein